MGSERLPIDPKDDYIEFFDKRIPKISGLEDCKDLKILNLRKNLITKIENIGHLLKLKELDVSCCELNNASLAAIGCITSLQVHWEKSGENFVIFLKKIGKISQNGHFLLKSLIISRFE